MSYDFKGNNAALVRSIHALLSLDTKGALAPNCLGEMARQLLEASASRLTEQHQGEPLPITHDMHRLMEAYRLGEFKADGGSDTIEALAVASFDTVADHGHDADSYMAGFCASLYWQAAPFIGMAIKPSTNAPKCDACEGHGVIGWTLGQTAESFEQGESPCEDCNATGYAHSNGMAVSGTCATCNGLGTVPDGEISGLDGIAFENGPVECVKDCPDCGSGPDALTDLATWKRRAIEAESKLRTYDPHILDLSQREMEALLADSRPTELVLMKCVLCDQLQTDLTDRDERLDQFEQVLQKVATLRGTLEQHGLRDQVEALLWPDLHSRPGERGAQGTEPCSGCGTPGWTGACNKCVPY